MNRHFSTTFFILWLFSQLAYTQYFAPGTDPLNIRWKQIKTPHVRVVFSDDMAPDAMRLAAMIDTLNYAGGYSLKHQPRKISILLHSRTVYANGFVSWAPRRSEFFTTPSQSLGSMDWIQNLAIHEYRHVVQMDKLNTGFTRFLGYLFGEQAVGAVGGLYLPFWFLEGDAVVTETLLSESGRGREPEFEQQLRAQMLEKGIYSMSKAYLGSYRHYVPNHYNMGYLMVAGVRSKYGSDVWSNAVLRTGRRSYGLIPFNRALKKSTGMYKRSLYKSVFSQWQQDWQHQDSMIVKNEYQPVTLPDNDFVSYKYLKKLDDNHIIAEKSGLGVVKSFVKIDANTGSESVVVIPGLHDDEPFDVASGVMVWTEMEPHWRWENQMFANIYLYDFKSEKIEKLTQRGRYYSPVVIDNNTFASVNVSESNVNSIVLLNSEGVEIKKILTPENQFPLTPVYNHSANELIMMLQGYDGKHIAACDLNSGSWRNITAPSFNQIRLPQIDGDNVLFTSSQTGIENIFKVPIAGGEPVQITSERFGASGAIGSGYDSILYSRYSAGGYRVVKSGVGEYDSENQGVANPGLQVIEKAKADELPVIDLNNLPQKDYKIKNYSHLNLFNIHSWAPSVIKPADEEVTAGVSVMSQNLLGTMVAMAGYNAESDSELEKYYLDIKYRAWYPVFSLNITNGNQDVKGQYLAVSGKDTVYVVNSGEMEQTKVKGLMSLPVNISKGRYYRYLEPYVGVEYRSNSGFNSLVTPLTYNGKEWLPKSDAKNITRGDFNYTDVQYGLLFQNLRRGASRDVGTRWGQSLQFKYRHSPWGKDNLGSMWGAYGRLYLPGFAKYHNVRLGAGYQKKYHGDTYGTTSTGYQARYLYSDFLVFPRGYRKRANDELITATVNYQFPLAYPDFSIGSVLYLKRLKTNLFHDYAIGWSNRKFTNGTIQKSSFNMSSVGAEIIGNTHFFQFLVPVDLGCRLSWLTDTKELSGEFVMNINIGEFAR